MAPCPGGRGVDTTGAVTSDMATVETGARLHFGFQNLALAHERLYGGVGVALDEPRAVVSATPDTEVVAPDALKEVTADAVSLLRERGHDLGGVRVTLEEAFARHVGLGSGTQFALATLVAVASAYDVAVDVRKAAPALGRGGRSGVGVATFEDGGFVVDAGHPTERFTTAPPARGEWTVPAPVVQREVPADWRFLLVTPAVEAGRHGDAEDESMRAAVERADPGTADDIAGLLTRRLLPAVAEGDLSAFGRAVVRLGRLNGAWYADEQGGVYRPPAGTLVDALGDDPAIRGAGQSSWGPTVYGVTHADDAAAARAAGEAALELAGTEGRVQVVGPRMTGASHSE
ncbi:MAG: beta-ribofuranosylaminobenzene 5'-phosphate synthase [Salinirussus sp.]|jgi:beta-ribofuranosylaminobenzene 5'-phosphate synthase